MYSQSNSQVMTIYGGFTMRELSVNVKLRAAKLFLTGYSYDEIARQIGISKGSVVNIIDLPPENGTRYNIVRRGVTCPQ